MAFAETMLGAALCCLVSCCWAQTGAAAIVRQAASASARGSNSIRVMGTSSDRGARCLAEAPAPSTQHLTQSLRRRIAVENVADRLVAAVRLFLENGESLSFVRHWLSGLWLKRHLVRQRLDGVVAGQEQILAMCGEPGDSPGGEDVPNGLHDGGMALRQFVVRRHDDRVVGVVRS